MSGVIGENDTVLIVIDEKRRFIVKVRRDGILGTDKGVVRLGDLIGKPYGSTIETSQGVKALVLKPLIHDYSLLVQRATQIIYPKDAGFMIYLSGIKPGSRVGEAGVGSGALTIALASIVGSSGLVYGFDISMKNLEVARVNLEKAGVADWVRLLQHDVRNPIDIPEELDAFFLDIPDPWNAIPSIARILRTCGALLVYSPTINQVEKTVIALRRHGCFTDIHAYETLLREYRVEEGAVRPLTRMIGHTGYIVFARKNTCSV